MDLMEKITALAKRRGFIYPGSEIYGGLANTYDYGPLGVELKNNIKNLWWKQFVRLRDDIYGIDGGIIMSPKVWEASGHVESFVDPLVECKACHNRFRLDQVEANKCPDCGGRLTEPRMFNGMFKTFIGATEDKSSVAYLRPETAQAIFINFKNIMDTFHPKLPFGIAQIGKAFRNEITAGNFIHRLLEFEQMEIEYFIDPKENWEKVFDYWLDQMKNFLSKIGVTESKIKVREHGEQERSHYSKKTVDLEYDFPFGVKEVYGLAYRTDFDLKMHSKASGKPLEYVDLKGKRVQPHIIEPSMGVDRSILVCLLESYKEDKDRLILSIPANIAPVKVAVFPLLANKEDLVKKAQEIYLKLKPEFNTVFDDRGNIGKRYYSQDEIGTPWCITVDFDTLKDYTVTVRDRDTAKQERVDVDKLQSYFQNRLK
jgi:glycyl-tRNA synthetase